MGTHSHYFSLNENSHKPYGSYKYPNSVFSYHASKITPRVWSKKENEILIQEVSTQRGLNVMIDWEQVAKAVGKWVEPMECFIQFRNVLDPLINKDKWSAEEANVLITLAAKYNEHNWAQIAMELNTNRTPMQCLKYYQQNLNEKMISSAEWTEEEDYELKEVVETYGTDNWDIVSAHMSTNRPAKQCARRYSKSSICQPTLITGTWLEEEERLLYLTCIAYGIPFADSFKKSRAELEKLLSMSTSSSSTVDVSQLPVSDIKETQCEVLNSLKSHELDQNDDMNLTSKDTSTTSSSVATNAPTQLTTSTTKRNNNNNTTTRYNMRSLLPDFRGWAEIAEYVPGKDRYQCCEKWFSNLDPTINTKSYTEEEDRILIEVIKHCGVGNWTEIASYMPGRTDASVRQRYVHYLKAESKQNKQNTETNNSKVKTNNKRKRI